MQEVTAGGEPEAARLLGARAHATLVPRTCQAGRNARKRARLAIDKKSAVAGEERKNSSKLDERRTNVPENKGPLENLPGKRECL
jgi:hypothetical protein